MAKPLDPKELVTFKELLVADSIQVDARVQLLIEEGMVSEQRFFQKLKQVKAQYQTRQPMFEKIISGGQTGADRAALDFAIRHRARHGG